MSSKRSPESPKTLTKARIVEALINDHEVEREQAVILVDAFCETIKQSLTATGIAKLMGLGQLVARRKKARPGRNPKTGAFAEVTARTTLLFRIHTPFRRLMNPTLKIK